MDNWAILEKVQFFSAWIIIFVGMISIVIAISCLCQKKPDMDDLLTLDQWQEVLQDRMAMTRRVNGARARLEREQRRSRRDEKLDYGDAGTSSFERQARIRDDQSTEGKEKRKTGGFDNGKGELSGVSFGPFSKNIKYDGVEVV